MHKLKVGDRVSTYNEYSEKPRKGEVGMVYPHRPIVMVQMDSGISGPFHYKQCRKLVRKPRQTLWVNHYPGEGGFLFAWDDKNKALERVEGTRKEPGREVLECVVVRRHKV